MLKSLPILLLLLVQPALSQPAEVVLFDEGEAGYRAASSGFASGGDALQLAGPNADKLPLTAQAFSGATGGLLEWNHVPGGAWEMAVTADGAPLNLTGFDSLIVYLNGPATISGYELPRFALQDATGTRTPFVWLGMLENVTIDPASGFTDESTTNVVLTPRYVGALAADQWRPGYPENLVLTFADAPLDTSQAGIGAPAIPAHFSVETEAGERLAFRFRDTNGDRTLSATGEYVEVLLPDEEGASQLRAAWRIEFSTSTPTPIVKPGAGDVYRLVLTVQASEVDGDPTTWQRLGFSITDLLRTTGFTASEVTALVFRHGGSSPEPRTLWFDRISAVQNDDLAFLDEVQRVTFDYFWKEANPANGLIRDRSRTTSPASIAAVGFGLSAYTVGIDRGWITRAQGIARTLATLRFFWNAPQSQSPDATGYKGFFYHFLDMDTGQRAWTSELSTVDTALLLGGVLHVGEYFSGDDPQEAEIRDLADKIYRRVDWPWAQNRPPAITLGWKPEIGFNICNGDLCDWLGYNEAMIVYILALGSPTYPVGPEAWDRWMQGYSGQWQTHYGYTFLTFPPLFGHQYSHVWIDFRDIQDDYMRAQGIDYFENSRRATLAQRAYHIANPGGWPNYGKDEWGLTASDTPTGYRARGAPPAQNDDGTLVPTAPGGSIPFAPEETIAALRHMRQSYPALWGPYGFRDAYNVSKGWFDNDYIGIDQGPILLMAENYRTEQIWETTMQNPYIQLGLSRAGFDVVTPVEDVPETVAFTLEAPRPHPVFATTTFRYTLTATGPVKLAVYDVLGREVAVLVESVKGPGAHETVFDATALPAGVYFYRLQQDAAVLTGKMIRVQ